MEEEQDIWRTAVNCKAIVFRNHWFCPHECLRNYAEI